MLIARTVSLSALLCLSIQCMAADAANSTDKSPEGNGFAIKQHFMEWMLTDQKFVEKAAEAGRAEIELSKLALQKSQTPQVKDFAKKMIDDHSAVALELDSVAHTKNLTVPQELDNSHQKELSRLQAANGADFDAQYIDVMTKDHNTAVSLFSAAADDKKIDPQLQNFAKKNLPTLKSHLEHVKSLLNLSGTSAK